MDTKRRLGSPGVAGDSAMAMVAGERGAWPRTRRAAPGDVVKLGFVTKFPVDFFFTLENAAKAWDEAHPGGRGAVRTGPGRHR